MSKSTTRVRDTFKLASHNGTILGTITIPPHWTAFIDMRGQVTFFIAPPAWRDCDADADVAVRQAILTKSCYCAGALELIGCSLEEFESLPGCSFAPGAAYLRSVMD
jgi:hypothetical protein